MREVSRARAWAGRGVALIAALACIATSKPRWHIEAAFPRQVPTVTPAGGRLGLAVTVEASRLPEVRCSTPDHRFQVLRPLAPATTTAPGAVRARYLCAPGWQLESVRIDEGSGEPRSSTPPPGEFVRITRLEAVETWTVSAETSAPIRPWDRSPEYGIATVVATSPLQPYFQASVEPGPAAAMFGVPSLMGPSTDGAHYEFLVPVTAPGGPYRGTIRVRATIYGACEASCNPPDPDALTLAPADDAG